jgi:hypothetical protein
VGDTNEQQDKDAYGYNYRESVFLHIANIIAHSLHLSNAIYGNMKTLFKKLDLIIDLLLKDRGDRQKESEARAEEKKQKERADADKLLVEYAKKHGKRLPTGGIWNGREAHDKLVMSDGDLIPFNLSEGDKAILNEFYNGD